ncbi:hypothetical protein [Dactylosporangium matsuzakiense]|uniref:hypothetical protein n=1 Tax=Dactylosporangium matsuzakiense TaxID=53360 RepID=UPI0021C49221|nr:hypothetical protein [Dactylosporangium matsuzakiense]UWZ42842.1 hypothetical protein Dmats_35750 [Dactylosporangium matsuzakiense]
MTAPRRSTVSRWDDLLGHAFGLLLGRPLTEFDPAATYAVFHYDDETAGEALGALDPAELVAEVSGPSEDRGGAWLGLERWVPDLAGSAFVAKSVRPAALKPLLATPADSGPAVVFGRDLGRALLEGALRLDELSPDAFRLYPVLLLRPRTDGSLLDAMRAATFTMSAPSGLNDIEGTLTRHGYLQPGASAVDPRWEPVLNQLDDDALRRHLRGLCLSAHWARSAGAYYLGPGECPADLQPIADLPGSTAIAGWEFGEGQGATLVVAAGPRC